MSDLKPCPFEAVAHRIVADFRPGGWPAKEAELANLLRRVFGPYTPPACQLLRDLAAEPPGGDVWDMARALSSYSERARALLYNAAPAPSTEVQSGEPAFHESGGSLNAPKSGEEGKVATATDVQVATRSEIADQPQLQPRAVPDRDTIQNSEVLSKSRAVSDEGALAALKLARPIVEADYCAAKEQCDADWEGMSFTALEAIDAVLAAQPRAVAGDVVAVPRELRRLSGLASPGPWEADYEYNEDGEYGSSPDPDRGYNDFLVLDGEGRSVMSTTDSIAKMIEVDYDDDGYANAWDQTGKLNATLACQAVNFVRALLAASPVEGGA